MLNLVCNPNTKVILDAYFLQLQIMQKENIFDPMIQEKEEYNHSLFKHFKKEDIFEDK